MKSYSRFRVKTGIGGGTAGQKMVKNRKGGIDPANPKEYDAQKQFESVMKEFERWCTHVQGNMGFILVDGLQIIFEDSQVRVPKKTGALKRSGYVTSQSSKSKAYAEIGYAKGGFPHYALTVHEDLTKFHEDPTQAKFLQAAIEEEFDNMKTFVEQATKDMAGF